MTNQTAPTKTLILLLATVIFSVASSDTEKYPVPIAPGLPYVDVAIGDKTVRIQRIQDVEHKLKNSYSKTSRPTPPFSIQPVVPVKGIRPVGELEVISFISNDVAKQSGVLIDARMPKWYHQGTIPGAVNIPFTVVQSESYRQIFDVLGVNGNDFSKALDLVVFDNGPWCQQGGEFIKSIVKNGYPTSKIKYFRNGMQYWQLLGFTTIQAEH